MRLILLTMVLVCLLTNPVAAAVSTDITLILPKGQLAGTLLLPPGPGPWPVVLILTGSEPVDRDGNLPGTSGLNNSFRQLAEGLARQGVASLRTDKRGVAGSESAGLSEKEMRLSHLVNDAVLWVHSLQKDERFTSVTVAGHSQGSQVGMNAAWQTGADGFVSLAGPGRPIIDTLRDQLHERLAMRSRVKADAILMEIEAGRPVPEVPSELSIILRPSVQAFLISWQQLDPLKDLARLSCPVAIIQGLTDIQVSEDDARLLHGAQPDATLLLLPGINHLFKPIEGDNPVEHFSSLTNPDLLFSPEAVTAVVDLTTAADQFHQTWQAALVRAEAHNTDGWPFSPSGPYDGTPGYAEMTPGQRVAYWVHKQTRESMDYRFGLAEGGYVSAGRLILDQHHDCVSFMYRCTEMARGHDYQDNLSWALRTRFAGAHPDSVVGPDGSVNYDRPEHLDYSLDMIRSGIWGRNISAELGVTAIDSLGTSRYPGGSFDWLPAGSLDPTQLQPGDIIWFVLNPEDKKARRLRDEYGLVIGHIGLMAEHEGRLRLFHAASNDLPDEYKGGRVVSINLVTYLERVERYSGIMVTRLE